MTAELVDDVRLRLPRGAWTFEDLLDTPDDGRRWEIIDGSLHVSPAPAVLHQVVANELISMLNKVVPDDWYALGPINLICGDSVLQPDVSVMHVDAIRLNSLRVDPSSVLLACEVVSPSSRTMDRSTKPSVLGEAGVPAYWRIEMTGPGAPFVVAYELDGGGYREVATVRAGEETTVTTPFPVTIRPTDLVAPSWRG
jgi:Uma2 family endonuclease